MKILNPSEKIILAIDGMNLDEAVVLLNDCPEIMWVKVGLELFTKDGPAAIKTFKKLDKKIFLDLKFHDIPNTMSAACYQVSKLGVDMISLHASAGSQALKAAKEATIQGSREINETPPILLGITVLTSLSQESFNRELKIESTIKENVLSLAKLSNSSGLNGCVCSPLEVKSLRSIYDNSFHLVTPGIRLQQDHNNDQNRVMTPMEALSSGASQIVVGRSITQAKHPKKAFSKICSDIK